MKINFSIFDSRHLNTNANTSEARIPALAPNTNTHANVNVNINGNKFNVNMNANADINKINMKYDVKKQHSMNICKNSTVESKTKTFLTSKHKDSESSISDDSDRNSKSISDLKDLLDANQPIKSIVRQVISKFKTEAN